MTFQLTEFIDIHTHILPGFDDGPKDLRGSIAMARCFENAGVRSIIATPHFLPGTAWAPSREKVVESVQALQEFLDSENIDLKVEAGMEIAFHKKIEDRILSNSLLSLGNSGSFLIEPLFHSEQESLLASLDSLLGQGKNLILAHPERIDGFQQRPELLRGFVAKGLRIQVNSGSLLGYFGKKSRLTAESLLRMKCLHFIASDAHNHTNRAPLTDCEWTNLNSSSEGKDLMTICKRNINEIFRGFFSS
jgi:protein-tyrosine phosphatase